MEMCFHHNQGHFAFVFDKIKYALNASFLHLLRISFKQDGETIYLGLDAGAKRAGFPIRTRFHQERNCFPNKIGDSFSLVALEAQFLQELVVAGGNTNAKLVTLAVGGAHGCYLNLSAALKKN